MKSRIALSTLAPMLALAVLLSGCASLDAQTPTPQAASPDTPAPSEETETRSSAPIEIPGTIEQQPAVGLLCPKLTGEVIGPCAAGRLWGAKVDVPQGSPTKATLTATWNASTPAAYSLRLSWRGAAGEFERGSSSPFVMEIPAEMIPAVGEYTLAARPDVLGATTDEVVHFVLTLDYA